MGYPLRTRTPHTTYHTQSRCHNLKQMMSNDKMKDLMEDVLIKAQQRYRFELVYYDIHDGEFDFIIKTLDEDEVDISRLMQFIKSQYALRYNRKKKRRGSFWNERFQDTIIDEMNDPVFYFNWLVWYLSNIPVRQKKVGDPRKYRYHTFFEYFGIERYPRVTITLHEYFLNLGKNHKERMKKFLEIGEIYRRRLTLPFL